MIAVDVNGNKGVIVATVVSVDSAVMCPKNRAFLANLSMGAISDHLFDNAIAVKVYIDRRHVFTF